ncbi:MAG: hypothetical protein RL542_125 [Bacteroidota bacterium]|jgi:hypothetical protein
MKIPNLLDTLKYLSESIFFTPKKIAQFIKLHFRIAYFFLIGISLSNCSSSDPNPVTSTFQYIAIQSTNANTPAGDCNIWNLKVEPVAMSLPIPVRTDSFAPHLLTNQVMSSQNSTYNKTAGIYLISTNQYVGKYYIKTSAATITSSAPTIYTISGVQAMEFVGSRLFFIINNYLTEYDVNSMTPITSFTPIHVGSANTTGYISNMTSLSGKLYFIVGGALKSLDTTIPNPSLNIINSNLPVNTSGTFMYNGLEVFDSSTFYAIKNQAAGSELIKITPSTTSVATSNININGERMSSAYDYTTEFYYLTTYNRNGDQTNILAFDLTPLNNNPIIINTNSTVTSYIFGLQLKE